MQIRVLIVVGIMWATLACGGARSGDPGSVPPGDVIVVHIENHNFYDATIYTSAGKRLRLGMVPGNGSRTFRFRWTHQALALVVDFIGAGGYVTDEIVVSAGDEIQLIIEAGDHRINPTRRPSE